jgi:hypothetical protein
MGFLDALFGKTKCPQCGTKGARTKGGKTRCPNPLCQNFDGTLGRSGVLRAAGLRKPRRSDFVPANALYIRYRNFQGQEKTFKGDREWIVRRRNHIIVRVAPTGETISLSRDRIQNLSEVEEALSETAAPEQLERTGPNARERQVLSYHLRYKSTSPLYEKIRAKYPGWVPPDLRNS